jgi:hypothetical protein
MLWRWITGQHSTTSDAANDAWGAALNEARAKGPEATAEFLRRYPPGTSFVETVVTAGAGGLKSAPGRFPGTAAAAEIDAAEKAAALSAANAPINKQGLSEAARAWDKHAYRKGGSTFEPLSGSTAERNEMASRFVQGVLDNPATVRTQLGRGGVEYRGPTGQGFRIDADGTFSGVLDPRR